MNILHYVRVSHVVHAFAVQVNIKLMVRGRLNEKVRWFGVKCNLLKFSKEEKRKNYNLHISWRK
jgi:hypothetical protein